jgi:flagellar basal-body rod modification protein FlgD
MEINPLASTDPTNGLRTLDELQNRTTGSELGRDAFLNLLVMQLANQDPLEPSSDTEFIAQLAQFSMLEQIQNLNTSFSSSQSFSLVGKYVYVESAGEGDEPELIFGKVDGVLKQDGIDYLLIGDEMYKASSVVGVFDSLTDGSLDENILQSANLIGKLVTAEIPGEEGEDPTIVTGIVEKITIKDGVLYATVDGQDIRVTDITEISEQES